MKILHTADIHLGVKNSKLSKDKQNLLQDEALYNIRSFFEMAKNKEFDAILICGDLFHGKSVASKFAKTFFDAVETFANPVIYITGNHDNNFILPSNTPENFVILDKIRPQFSYLDCDFYCCLPVELNSSQNNVLLLHGNIESTQDNDYFDINQYLNKGFDYIALGHVHQFKKYSQNKDIFAYPGCLFSNGFDEGGEKGFVELEISNKEVKLLKFCPFKTRKFIVCESNISGLTTNRQIIQKIEEDLAGKANFEDLVKIVLKGAISEDCEKSIPLILNKLYNYFYVEIEDKTTLKIDIDKIKSEKLSFKYEFISLVEESDLDEESKRLVCEIGLEALKGEDINI